MKLALTGTEKPSTSQEATPPPSKNQLNNQGETFLNNILPDLKQS